MATNNKHPGNHRGPGSDSHVTGSQFFSVGGARKIVSSPRGISCPLGFPYLELEGRGQLGRWPYTHTRPHCSVRSRSQG